jgi:peptide/nickel transport system permease protein
MASWGGMMREHYGYLLLGKPWLALIPGIAISLLVLAFVMLGNALREVTDVKSQLKF